MKTNKLLTYIDRLNGQQLAIIAIGIPFFFSLMYLIISHCFPEHGIIVPSCDSTNVKVNFLDAFYFSVITTTTTGYGDIRPIGFSRILVCIQVISGLIIAGILVSKITSSYGKALRDILKYAEGYWLEPFEKKGQSTMFTFSRIFFDGEEIRYDGDNYDDKGEYQGSYRGYYISRDGNCLTFQYYNLEKKDLFDSGFIDVTFSSNSENTKWVSHEATCYDKNKEETTKYIGFRAANVIDIQTFKSFKSDDTYAKTLIIRKHIDILKKRKS